VLNYIVLPVRIIYVRMFITCVDTGIAKLFFLLEIVRKELVDNCKLRRTYILGTLKTDIDVDVISRRIYFEVESGCLYYLNFPRDLRLLSNQIVCIAT
jgi:hypothetical protein